MTVHYRNSLVTLKMVGSTLPSYTLPWYLAGGIAYSNCLAAYKPKGAANIADSYTNLANPGTYTVTPVVGTTPIWNAATGWGCGPTCYFMTGPTIATSVQLPSVNASVIIRYSDLLAPGGFWEYLCGQTDTMGAISISTDSKGDLIIYDSLSFYLDLINIDCVYALTPIGVYENGISTKVWFGAGPNTAPLGHFAIGAICDFLGGINLPTTGVNILALALYDIDITPYVGALTTAIQAL